ncbi:MAG: hemerythrin family protein [Candidatus Thiodiazotropha sp. (ex Lucinoma annulata)]|nr:hemerythrin family protein [Candidatus Thiodiazotropha sp. (ex Lucinoma borealis)]MCU7838265.1 hemerythrin family protein [Candidatus Thiodiazotropha sp. (ex Troendleina suluensis)]MCU7883765.1 hemerythrin family protein [Candidatus Thiodiazotropha sp. (ex Lucinoma annulata)]MCU7947161.1 hemerythrin family protein [Candidatus Thiodiazotropha sp. (ex Cardiolucina cf. quadrata)]MCU7865101.1 hemerythrin family protein [Candidatus Thiodiazotropha sp. (ex Lucinoma borealis)]
MHKRRPIQKVLIVIAVISYLAAIACGVAAFYFGKGTFDPITASLMASVVFFVGVGVVLHVISNTDLPNLKIEL